MRKIIILFALLLGTAVFSQNEIGKKVGQLVAADKTFVPYSVLAESGAVADDQINQVVTQSTLATLKTQDLSRLLARRDAFIELEIPYQNQTISLQLYRDEVLADGFHVDTDKDRNIVYNPGVYYRGIVKGDYLSVAAFSFFNNELVGMVSSRSLNNLVVGKLNKPNNTSEYIVYSDANMAIQNDFECHTQDPVANQPSPQRDNNVLLTDKCVTFYFEVDYDLYSANGVSTTNTTNWMTAVFNNVKTLYANDGINVALKSIYIWTQQDPYFGEGSSDYLNMFNEQRPIFDGDVGQLVSIDSGGLGGVARTINGLCGVNNYSYSDVSFGFSTVPTYSWTIMVVTHEFGHLLGSPHTHACIWNGDNSPIDSCGPYSIGSTGEGYGCMATPPLLPSASQKGSIMSYCHLVNGIGINLANGFGPQPKQRVLDAVNGATCLSTDCINTCINTVVGVNTEFITPTTAVISWDQLSNTSNWLVSVVPYTSTPVWTPVTGIQYTVTDLLPNTFYKVTVRPDCDASITTETVQSMFLTEADYCSGNIVITDSGGVSGNHSHNENYVRTMIPSIPGTKLKLTFTSFWLSGQDWLYIYDGNSTSAPDLTNGGLRGTTIPGPYQSTAADGSLTIRFTSDDVVLRPGYAAAVSCTNLLATDGFEPNIDFTYSPNPTDGVVGVVSRTPIDSVEVYNSLGQLLYRGNEKAFEAKVDLSAFASGTYFFKLKFKDKQAHFKILKQ